MINFIRHLNKLIHGVFIFFAFFGKKLTQVTGVI
jgi:hypothetical protein